MSGFDLSGMDLWSAGTLYKNISFLLLPSSDSTAVWHFEGAWVRFDNLKNSPWLNVKFGRFELDNLISEKRMLFLSNNGGIYQIYHFNTPGSSNNFGYGDNQIGVELAGHSVNSYTRYSVSVLSSNEGGVGFTNDVVPGGSAGEPHLRREPGLQSGLRRQEAWVSSASALSPTSANAPLTIRPQAREASSSSAWATSRSIVWVLRVTSTSTISSYCHYSCTGMTTRISGLRRRRTVLYLQTGRHLPSTEAFSNPITTSIPKT